MGHTVQVPAATDKSRARCPSVQKALRFYTERWQHWTQMRGQRLSFRGRAGHCPRYLLKIRKAKAAAAHRAWDRWFHYHYAWSEWLPDKWARIGACETGYGRRPGSWTWDSGTYVSAFGVFRPAYSQFAHYIGQLSWDETRMRLRRLPTPREQYNVADAIQRRFGFGAWGCGGA